MDRLFNNPQEGEMVLVKADGTVWAIMDDLTVDFLEDSDLWIEIEA